MTTKITAEQLREILADKGKYDPHAPWTEKDKLYFLFPDLIEMAEELAALRNVAEELLEDTPEFVGGCCYDSYCAACGGEDETHAPICPRVSLRAALDALPKEKTNDI
jgi:hypothetical protein